jgi:hypothetical protein
MTVFFSGKIMSSKNCRQNSAVVLQLAACIKEVPPAPTMAQNRCGHKSIGLGKITFLYFWGLGTLLVQKIQSKYKILALAVFAAVVQQLITARPCTNQTSIKYAVINHLSPH